MDPRILRALPDLVRDLGGDPDALMREAGGGAGVAGADDAAVSYRLMVDCVGLAAVRLHCPDFGMRLAQRQAGAIHSPLLAVVRNSRTLGDALEHVIRLGFAHSLAAALWMKRYPDEAIVRVGHDILIEGAPERRQAIEQILLIEYLTCREATGGHARARRVEFRHQPMAAPAVYRAHFGCAVRFGQDVDAIVYGEAAMACPIVAPDAAARDRAIAAIDTAFAARERPLHAQVRSEVIHRLGQAACANADVASALGVHLRTLHRRLRAEGTSFRQIKHEVRRDRLIACLDQTDLSIAQISERLGFAEQSATSRFCRQVLGEAPRQRKAGAKPGA